MHYRRKIRFRPARSGKKIGVLLFSAACAAFVLCACFYLRTISTEIAVSDAGDAVSMHINNAISELMAEEKYSADSFVSFEKGTDGEVRAISCNMPQINALSAELLEKVLGSADNYTATVRIPLGNLSGISLLMGRGPKIPIQIVTLTSSRVGFKNNLVSAGINQTRHQISLEVKVDIDILIPWGSKSTQVVTEVLIADTVIVGQVPDTYFEILGPEESN